MGVRSSPTQDQGSRQPGTAPLCKLGKGTPAPTLYISLNIKLPFCRSKTVDGPTYYFHLLGTVINDSIIKLKSIGNSLAIQWLGLCISTAGGPGSNPGRGTRIPPFGILKKKIKIYEADKMVTPPTHTPDKVLSLCSTQLAQPDTATQPRILTASQAAGSCLKRELVSSTDTRLR